MTTATERAAETSAAPPRRGGAAGVRRNGSRRRRARSGSLDQQRRKLLVPFVGPALLVYVILFVVPIGAAAWISLHKWAGAGPMTWVGFRNYVSLADSEVFRQALFNTLLLLFVVGAAVFVLSFAMTLVLRDMLGRKSARSIIFFPHLVNALVYGVLAGFIFNPDGLVNKALAPLGVKDPPAWLAQDNLFPLIMLTLTFITTGYYTTILMAGVDRIPRYYYEDCALAGANAWQRLRFVTLPLTWDVFAVCAVLWTISSVKIFEVVWIFGGGGGAGIPPTETWTSAVYTYVTAFSGESIPAFGAATASAMISLLLVSVLVLLLRRAMRRDAIEF